MQDDAKKMSDEKWYKNKKTLFDVTIWPAHHDYKSWREVAEAAAPVFKKFVFQKEVAPNAEGDGTHWQFRGALHKQEWASNVIKDLIPKFPGHWTLTSKDVHDSARHFNYVMKEQTKVEGPWSEKDLEKEEVKMTAQLEQFLTFDLYPWQQTLQEMISVVNFRTIILIYDPHGNAGKSIFAEYLEYKGLAFELPPMRAMEDIMQFAYSFDDQKCYLVDMPRGMKKDKLADFYAGLECLKNGVVWDKRYGGKKRRMTRPHIVVFTNMLPVFSLMTPDRWVVKEMTPDKELIDWKADSDQFED